MVATEAETDSFAEALESEGYHQAELRACRALRGQIPLYIKGEIGASALRDKLTKCSTIAEYESLLMEFELASQSRPRGVAV